MKENFDDILKRKLEERHFPVDESHRAEMIDLLESKKRRKVFPIWWLGSLVVVLAVAGYFLMANQDASNKSTATSIHHPSGDDDANVVVRPSEENNSVENASENPGSQSHSITTPSHSTSSAAPQSSNTSSQGLHTRKAETAKPKSTTTLNKNAISKSQNTILPLTQDHQNAKKPTVKTSKEVAPLMTLETKAEEKQVEQTHLPIDKTSSSAIELTVNEELNENLIEPLVVVERDLVEPLDYLESLDIQELALNSEFKMLPIEPTKSFKKSLYLFGEAGTGLILASKPHFTSGWKLKAGGGVGYRLSSKMQLALTAGYLMQDGGFDFERTSTVQQLGFGLRSSINSLTPEKLHFVYSRIGLSYRLKRNIFSVHGGAQWLYGAQGTIIVHTSDSVVPGETTNTSYSWLKTDGLRKLNWTGDISYGYQFTPRISLSAGTDIYFSSFTVEDQALTDDGYYWKGKLAALHPFITINYLINGRL